MKKELKSLQFKTNINCDGCIASIKPNLDNIEGICEWKVDTANKDKILTVKTEDLTENQVIEIVKTAGYKAELM